VYHSKSSSKTKVIIKPSFQFAVKYTYIYSINASKLLVAAMPVFLYYYAMNTNN